MNFTPLIILIFVIFTSQSVVAKLHKARCSSAINVNLAPQQPEENVKLNTLQSFRFGIYDSSGDMIKIKHIKLDAAMPAHRHGMPTTPIIEYNKTEAGSYYLAQGLMFQMAGQWQATLEFKIKAELINLTWDINLPYKANKPLTSYLVNEKMSCYTETKH